MNFIKKKNNKPSGVAKKVAVCSLVLGILGSTTGCRLFNANDKETESEVQSKETEVETLSPEFAENALGVAGTFWMEDVGAIKTDLNITGANITSMIASDKEGYSLKISGKLTTPSLENAEDEENTYYATTAYEIDSELYQKAKALLSSKVADASNVSEFLGSVINVLASKDPKSLSLVDEKDVDSKELQNKVINYFNSHNINKIDSDAEKTELIAIYEPQILKEGNNKIAEASFGAMFLTEINGKYYLLNTAVATTNEKVLSELSTKPTAIYSNYANNDILGTQSPFKTYAGVLRIDRMNIGNASLQVEESDTVEK